MSEDRQKTLAIVLGSTAATGVLLSLSLWLGGWAYSTRSSSLHDGRLKRLLELRPHVDQVREGVLAETGNRLIDTPATEDGLRRLVAGWAPARAEEAVEKRRRWPRLLIFGARDAVYFVYFDAEGTMRDYLLITGRRP